MTSQVSTGLRSILSNPSIYSAFQYFMGAQKGWSDFANNYVRPKAGDAVLDIGCGPADIVDFLPMVDYWGFDISEEYITKAKAKYGLRGNFFAKILAPSDLENMPKFDLVTACGLLHHVNDDTAAEVFRLAQAALKPGGRLVTIDPCYATDQSMVARYLISKDRGQHVRNLSGYERLARSVFSESLAIVRHKTWIPYTHCIIQCTR